MTTARDQSPTLAAWRASYATDLMGEHPGMLAVLASLRRIASTHCDVLVTGASGTGKELVARAIHRASSRASRPFIALNCAAIPKELMESEIFGHVRGAFTGATERRVGKFQMANGGTLFLDEVGEMELSLQSKLLRVLQERELNPVGSSQTVRLDVRIIAATNQDLGALCQERTFREDLYYRLNVVPLHLPTLAERQQDIPCLVEYFLGRANRRHNRMIAGVDAEATAAMCHYSWPGNVRELHNLVERIVVLKADDGPIGMMDLPSHVAGIASLHPPANLPATTLGLGAPMSLPQEGLDINDIIARMETRLTREALERADGNKTDAARLLGLKRTTLVERLKKLNIPDPCL